MKTHVPTRVDARVTRLGEFPPIRKLFTSIRVLKITEICSINWATFFRGANYELILTNNLLGYILGDFFTNSSGHPGRCICQVLGWKPDQNSVTDGQYFVLKRAYCA
jgi:hypothetical protein